MYFWVVCIGTGVVYQTSGFGARLSYSSGVFPGNLERIAKNTKKKSSTSFFKRTWVDHNRVKILLVNSLVIATPRMVVAVASDPNFVYSTSVHQSGAGLFGTTPRILRNEIVPVATEHETTIPSACCRVL